MTAMPSAAGPRKSAAPSARSPREASRAPGARSGASTSGTVFARTPSPRKRQAAEPRGDVARAVVRPKGGDGQRHQETDLDVAVPVLADEDDRHRVERDPDEERAPDGGTAGTV